MAELPAFEDGRRSDCRPGAGRDAGQAAALREARTDLRTAKEALNRTSD